MKSISTIILLVIGVLAFSNQTATAKKKDLGVYDAIIVPGYPFKPNGKMNAIYQMRLHWANQLYTTGVAKNIIVSGSAVHSPYVESQIFALYLEEMGVNPDHLIIEDQAEHSLENVFYSLELAKERGFEKVAVATDLFHTGMIQVFGKKHDLAIDYLPANIGFILTKKWNSFKGTIDYCQAYVADFVPLKERETKKERMNGTRGDTWIDKNTLTMNTPALH